MTTKPQTPPVPATSASQLLRINDVVALTTLSKSCVNLSSTLKVWRFSDLSDWIDEQFTATDDADCIEQSGRAATMAPTEGKYK